MDDTVGDVAAAVADVDVVIVENVASLPLHPAATAATAAAIRGRPAILHHHDLPWQRSRFSTVSGWPPDDGAWRHVTINDLSRRQLADRGIRAVTIYNGFADEAPGDRATARRAAGIAADEPVVLHPVRAIARKRIDVAVRLAERVGATYLLTGPVEEGYEGELSEILAGARCRTIHLTAPTPADAYAAADAAALPSDWEGFGNAVVESALHRRPLAIAPYPVAEELQERFGFRWLPVHDHRPLARFLAEPDQSLLEHNREVARRHFSMERLSADIASFLAGAGWA